MQKGSALKVVVLVVAVLVLVLALWMSKSNQMTGGPTASPTVSPMVSASPVSNSNLSPAERLFKEEPSAGSSQELQTTHFQKISATAVAASSINVSSCTPNPSVAKVMMGSFVTFKNNDSMSHKLYNGAIGNIQVPARGEYKYKATQQGGLGYTCDDKLVGILFVTQ